MAERSPYDRSRVRRDRGLPQTGSPAALPPPGGAMGVLVENDLARARERPDFSAGGALPGASAPASFPAAIVAVGIPPTPGGAWRPSPRSRGKCAGGASAFRCSSPRPQRRIACGGPAGGNRMRYRIGTRDLPRGPLEMPVLRLEEDERAPLKRRTPGGRPRARGTAPYRPLWEPCSDGTSPIPPRSARARSPRGASKSPTSVPSGYGLDVREMIALTPAAARTLWRFLAGHPPLARTLERDGPAGEPLTFLIPEGHAVPQANERWLVRVLDPVAALEARGYGAGGSKRAFGWSWRTRSFRTTPGRCCWRWRMARVA